jgi:hypothetical protein
MVFLKPKHEQPKTNLNKEPASRKNFIYYFAMSDSSDLPASIETELSSEKAVLTPDIAYHKFRRNLFPSDLALSADDLAQLCELVLQINENAKEIVVQRESANFPSIDEARNRVDEVVKVEYAYNSARGDRTEGLPPLKVENPSFPEDLTNFYVSNTAYSQRINNYVPACAVDIFLSFQKPSLSIDLITMPSNPTDNRSVINVYGLDEDWVRATETRLVEFFEKRKKLRLVIHKSGAYDYLLYLLYLPMVLLLVHSHLGPFLNWTQEQPTFFTIILAIYLFFMTLLGGRILFQYVRWLFPPMEFYKTTRLPAQIHRAVGFTLLMAILLPSVFNIVVWAVKALVEPSSGP